MLVLSRKKGEVIVIGDNIEITVLSVDGDAIKLGISAPKEVEVYRKEVYVSIQQSNEEASLNKLKLGQLKNIMQTKK